MEANTSEGSVVKFIVEKTADKIIRKNGNEEEDLGDVYTPEKAAKESTTEVIQIAVESITECCVIETPSIITPSIDFPSQRMPFGKYNNSV